MAQPSDPEETQLFLATAQSQALLTAAHAEILRHESARLGTPASQLALEQGLLDAVQVDMVQTLLRPGAVIPGYEILGVLGRGGMGIVYRARQQNLDRTVAIKTVLLSQLTQAEAVGRFEKEARTVGGLRHPNIVTAFDFGRHQGRLFLVMELLEGETLEDRIEREGRISEALAWSLALQAAAGLAHATEAGIVHRDIKPTNLFLVQPPAGLPFPPGVPLVKITDFGLVLQARAEDEGRLTVSGRTLGTPIYMAPEQFTSSEVDCRADIYSLGATVYHMLAGRPPFTGESIWQILDQKMKPAAEPLRQWAPDVSRESADLIADMMAREPAQRVAGYRELLDRISRLPPVQALHATTPWAPTASLTGPAVLPSRPTPGRRPTWRRWAKAATAAAMVSGGAIALARWSPWTAGIPELLPSTRHETLFDGVSVDPPSWMVRDGQWRQALDAEGGRILAGRGAIRRWLPHTENYEVIVGVDRHEAGAVELHFGIPAEGDASRFGIRVTADGVVLISRRGLRGPWEPRSTARPAPPPADAPAYHEMRVEKRGPRWLVFFRGEELGQLPVPSSMDLLPAIELVAEDGAAFFDTLEFTELVPARK